MAMTMKEKAANTHVKTEWPAALKAEFAREAERPNGCVGSELLSETDKLRVWTIRLKPGERIGFHLHVLNYFWAVVNGARVRLQLLDVSTVEYSYHPGETRHETYGPGEFKVHDLENLGDQDMIFMTVESIEGSANKPLAVPETVRLKAAESRAPPLVPAKAGTQSQELDSRLRGNERGSWKRHSAAAAVAARSATIMKRSKNAASCAAPSSGRTCATNWSGRTTTMQPRSRSMPRMVKMSLPLFGSAQNIFS